MSISSFLLHDIESITITASFSFDV